MSDKEYNYKLVYTKKANKDKPKLKAAKLDGIAKNLVELVKVDPRTKEPPYKELQGNMKGAYSRRINNKHRFVYQVYEDIKVVKVISMWTHYEFPASLISDEHPLNLLNKQKNDDNF